MEEHALERFAGTYRITEVKSDPGSDITGFATEEERLTLYFSRRTKELRCLVTKEFSRDRLNWERIRFSGCPDKRGVIRARISGHDVSFEIEDGKLLGRIDGNPTGTIMAEVD